MEFHLIPKYRATTVVEALLIKEVRVTLDGANEKVITLVPDDERFKPFVFQPDMRYAVHGGVVPGEYWVRDSEGHQHSLPASFFENGQYQLATPLTPELLKNIRAVVAKDLISDEEVSKISQMVLNELHEENRGVIGGPDVIHMQYPARLSEAVVEMVLNKLKAMA